MPMVKGAKYSMGTGDEAGSAQGVASNKIKGECEFMMYSFDVKFEGKDVVKKNIVVALEKKNMHLLSMLN
jgi:hypothetical protein